MGLKDFDWRATVSAIAPALGTALGGPLGGLAGGMVAQALGAPKDATDNELEAAARTATPDQLLALKQADHDFEAHLQELGVKLEEIAASDRANARAMQTATQSRVPAALTFTLTIGFFAALGGMFFFEIPVSNRDLVNIMVGSLGTAWIASTAFWFGTTRDSSRKTELLAQSAPAR